MDAEGRFALGSDEFTRLIGAHTAAGFGRPWSEIAEMFGLDPEGRVDCPGNDLVETDITKEASE